MDNVEIGTIFVCSWGYDQTNVDFYQVVKRTAKMVTVRKIRAIHEAAYHLASYLMPIKNGFLDRDHPFEKEYGKPMTRKLQFLEDGRMFFKPASYSMAQVWDGRPRTETYTG